MSTRGSIVIKLRDEDCGKKIKVNPTVLTNNEELINLYNEKCFEIVLDGKYGEIYCHHDSYPNGLGISLLEYWNTYEKVLNLILSGDTSGVSDTTDSYVFDEEYDDNKPTFTNDVPTRHQEYQYMFDNDVWYFRGICDNTEWTPVKKYLEKRCN